MKTWEKHALETLTSSLVPIPHEKNELDWKQDLSENKDRLKEHLSAFSNIPGGGYLVFGINQTGKPVGVKGRPYSEMMTKLGNIAREALEPSVSLEHTITSFQGVELLVIRIPESRERPVHIRGKSMYEAFTRSAGQTRKLERREIARLISESSGVAFEEETASEIVTADDVFDLLEVQAYFDLLKRPHSQSREQAIDILIADRLLKMEEGAYRITNLGAVLFAKDLTKFDHLKRKAIRVILYDAEDRRNAKKEQIGKRGYAVGFSGLVKWINNELPANEEIGQAFRREVRMYPELAIRELVANALIHQDFSDTGTGPMVEVFSDRIEFTNPGRPLVTALRLIDHPPKSRNEALASLMRNLGICEERGSGIDKIIFEIELFQLPPPDFTEYESNFRVTLYGHRALTRMSKVERIRACYQHCVLRHVSGQQMNNQTLRKRFDIKEENYPMASRIISEAIDAELIKTSDPESKSRKYATYVPFWA